MTTIINLNNTTPAAPAGNVNVSWQFDGNTPENVSAYVPVSSPNPGGADKEVQFNDSGALAGATELNYDKASGVTSFGAVAGFSGKVVFIGLTSGTAALQCAAVAGSPNALQLPTATGTSGFFLATDGNNPQQLSWTNAFVYPSVTGTGFTFSGLNLDATGSNRLIKINPSDALLYPIHFENPSGGVVDVGFSGTNITGGTLTINCQNGIGILSIGKQTLQYLVVGGGGLFELHNGGLGAAFQVDMDSMNFRAYGPYTLAGGGVASIPAVSKLTTQSAAITATTILAVLATAAGLYRISYRASVTTAATSTSSLGGTNGFQVIYTDLNDSVVKTSNPTTPVVSAANTTATTISGVLYANCKASTNLQYAFDYASSGGTAMVYDLDIFVEYLG